MARNQGKKRSEAQGKALVIHDLIDAVEAIKADVRADSLKLVQAMPIDIVADQAAVEDYLTEMCKLIIERHIMRGKVVNPKVKTAVVAYVKGMAKPI